MDAENTIMIWSQILIIGASFAAIIIAANVAKHAQEEINEITSGDFKQRND